MMKSFFRLFPLLLCAVLVTACLVLPSAAEDTQDTTKTIFLKLDGVTGESSDPDHIGWIDLLTFSHGASDATEEDARKISEPFRFQHAVDKATPKIQETCMTGEHIATGEVQFCRVIGGSLCVTYQILLEDISITSAIVSVEDLPEGNFRIVEDVSVIAAKTRWVASSYDASGAFLGDTQGTFDAGDRTSPSAGTGDTPAPKEPTETDTADRTGIIPIAVTVISSVALLSCAAVLITLIITKSRRTPSSE